MGRNAPAPVRDYLLNRHRQAGVRVLLNSAIEHAEAGEFLSLTLQNGETLQADALVYGIGIVANDALAREAGWRRLTVLSLTPHASPPIPRFSPPVMWR